MGRWRRRRGEEIRPKNRLQSQKILRRQMQQAVSGKENAKAKRKAALAKAAHYRKQVATPGHCGWGWYWNHKYRTCWRSPDSKMLVYTLKGAAKGLCVNSWGNPRVAGSVLALWDCLATGRQQFTQEIGWKRALFPSQECLWRLLSRKVREIRGGSRYGKMQEPGVAALEI